MQSLRNLLFNTCFAINCLLLFFLTVESSLVIPAWLQIMGRMHPLLLHLPITLVILYIFWTLFIEQKHRTNDAMMNIGTWLLLLCSFTASSTAIMGLLLSKEDGYDNSALQLHKWSGVGIALLTWVWYAYRRQISQAKWLSFATVTISLILIIFTGHQGAEITHGQNFLMAPVKHEKKSSGVKFEDAVVYTDMVIPILQSKCIGCHNARKAKGELVMDTEELLLKGGKNGKLWDNSVSSHGLLLGRISLPVSAKEHMPPMGKPQLSEEEKKILYLWIKGGAGFDTRVADLTETDSLQMIAKKKFNSDETDSYDFGVADAREVKKLNTNYRRVAPLAQHSPALAVDFFSAQAFTPSQLKDLLVIKRQLVHLSVAKMPIKDDDLAFISQFTSLRKLNLSFTSITGSSLTELNKLTELRQLSVSGTSVKKESLLALSTHKKLKHLYIWNTSLSDEDIAFVQKKMMNIEIEAGLKNDTSILQLTPPILLNDEQIITSPVKLKLKHYINGVAIRYTLDGSEPDSINSPLYSNSSSIMLAKNTVLKTKAFKRGWLSSPVFENYFFSSTYKPDSAISLLPPDQEYKGTGAKTLFDLLKGEPGSPRSGRWLGFRKNKMETLFLFQQSVTMSNVTISSLIDIGGYIMPPLVLEIWGGNDPDHLKKLSRLVPPQPDKLQPAYLKAFELRFSPVTVRYLKVIALPVSKLPAWHPGNGDKGWVFVDEIFIN